MTLLVADLRVITDSLLTALRAQRDDSNNLLSFGDHQSPDPPTGQVAPAMPYGVVYAIPGGALDGPFLGQSHSDTTVVFQIDGVGASRGQAQWMQTRIRDAVLGQDSAGHYRMAISVSGQVVIRRELDHAHGVDPEGALWSSKDRFSLWLTPA